MPKVKVIESGDTIQVWFYCPGCKTHHAFTVKAPKPQTVWTWNNNVEKPTFSPSLLCIYGYNGPKCHSFVRDGKIQFLADCHHQLKNQTVEIPEIDW